MAHDGVNTIDVQSLAKQQGATLIDVREDDEYRGGHAPDAQLIPLGQVESRIGELPTDHTVYVICASGRRSAQAAETMRQHGIDAVSVEGGTQAWAAADFPIVQES
jgi:rhodanese-related sulfurtransferase